MSVAFEDFAANGARNAPARLCDVRAGRLVGGRASRQSVELTFELETQHAHARHENGLQVSARIAMHHHVANEKDLVALFAVECQAQPVSHLSDQLELSLECRTD